MGDIIGGELGGDVMIGDVIGDIGGDISVRGFENLTIGRDGEEESETVELDWVEFGLPM